MDKKLGIIGGMGPMATSIFYERIINNTKADSDQDHIWTIISSHTQIPDRTDLIVNEKDPQKLLESVKADLEIMEYAQVSNISIPCNTFHYYYDQVQDMTEIPIINMVEETILELKKRNIKRVCVLSTLGTKKARVYESYAQKHGIEVADVDLTYYTQLGNLIYDIKSSNKVAKEEFKDLVEEIHKAYKPEGFVIACTELSLISLDQLEHFEIIDAMDILVRESIVRSDYELNK